MLLFIVAWAIGLPEMTTFQGVQNKPFQMQKEIQNGTRVHMHLVFKKPNFKTSKNLNQNLGHASSHSMSLQSRCTKNRHFLACVKKTKKMSHEMAFCSTKICLFCIGHTKCRIPVKQLRDHRECQDLCENIFLKFFVHLKIWSKCISKTGCICTREPKRCPRAMVDPFLD